MVFIEFVGFLESKIRDSLRCHFTHDLSPITHDPVVALCPMLYAMVIDEIDQIDQTN
jgi:hypothetical protein